MRRHLFFLFVLVLALKFSYFLFYRVCYASIDEVKNVEQRTFLTLFNKSDAGWYERIANNGYPRIENKQDIGYTIGSTYHQTEWAFFPVYPMTVKAVMILFNTDFNHAACFLSIIYCFLGFVAFYYLNRIVFEKTYNESFRNTIILALLPFNYYFSMYYTEALFLALLATCFIAIKLDKLWIVSLLLIPLAIIRANGFVMLLPLYLYYLEQNKKGYFTMDLRTWLRSFYFIPGVLSFAGYCLYQKYMTHEYFAFSLAQAGWYRETMFPFFSLFRHGDVTTQFNSIYVIVYMAIAILARKKFPVSMNLMLWVCIILPLCSGSVMAIQRYITQVFPFTLILCDVLKKVNFGKIVVPGLIVLHFITFYLWIISHMLSF